MAAAYCKVVLNGEIIRTFGGNRKEVRELASRYSKMDVRQFCAEHPRFENKCREAFDLRVRIFINPR